MTRTITPLLTHGLFAVVLAACGDTTDAGPADGTGGSESGGADDLEICDPANGPFSLEINNPYLPFVVGAMHELAGLEAGTDQARFTLLVLDEVEQVQGVMTRPVRKTSYGQDGTEEVLEAVSTNWYAQAPDGSVCLFGEFEELYADGVVEAAEGWRAGEDDARAVVAMPAMPTVGQTFTAIYLPPDEVEVTEVTEVGVPATTPAGVLDDTVTLLEEGPSIKKFARGIGEVYDDGIELTAY